MKLSIIGLGKLGCALAVAFASKEVNVFGIDINPEVVRFINNGNSHVYEPGLREALKAALPYLQATTVTEEAVLQTDTTIVLVPTPSNDDGSFSNEYVLQVCKSVGQTLAVHDRYHVVVISSTVMPGSCDGEIREALEKASGRIVGKDLGLCYCPEFVALGNALEGFMNPDFVLIGESDFKAGEQVERLYDQLVSQEVPILHRSLLNAEIAKIALNFTITAKISVANALAEICEGIPGANVDQVTSVLGADKRIGKLYLKGGAPFGGTCFPRDVNALICLARNSYANAILPQAVELLNEWQKQRIATKVFGALKSGGMLGILGLAFKPHTDVITEGLGSYLLQKAVEHRTASVIMYDKVVTTGYSVSCAQVIADDADVVVICLPVNYGVWFRKGQTVIDVWRVLDRKIVEAQGAIYVAVGVGECTQ